tara:strand:+ start:773 stop:1660 length:888 start_codon:yes stop_codon:yes gene_type:complete
MAKWIVPIVIVVILALNAFFIVPQTHQAIVLEFGKPVEFADGDKTVSYINTPGLKFKLPFIQEVKYFDGRILDFTAKDKEVLDLEKKALTVNAFAKYKIIDPLIFYQKVTNEDGIRNRLDKIFEASLRDAIGSVPLKKLLTEVRTDVMNKIRSDVSQKAKDFGIAVLDVRIVRSDLPRENSDSIYKRMYADRDKEAREYRAQGEEQSKIIRSEADKQVKILLAEARREGQIIRGQGEAEATRIFANAFTKDPEFFNFYRTMLAYRATLKDSNTRMVLSPDSEFLQYLSDISSAKR